MASREKMLIIWNLNSILGNTLTCVEIDIHIEVKLIPGIWDFIVLSIFWDLFILQVKAMNE